MNIEEDCQTEAFRLAGAASPCDNEALSSNRPTMQKNQPDKTQRRFVSLFSGGMGLDLGLERAGFEPLLCNEIDSMAVETVKLNRPDLPVLGCSIEEITGKQVRKESGLGRAQLDLLAGGPPCQSFSVYGNRKGIHDGRGRMLFEYLRMVDELRPKVFIMENVRGLHSMPLIPEKLLDEVKGAEPWMAEKGSLVRELIRQFELIGYRVDGFLVNSVNYGAPQIRERLILIGNRYGLTANFPMPSHSNRPEDGLVPFKTLRDAIGSDFRDPDPSLMNFSPRKLKYLKMVPAGGNWRSLPIDVQKESMGKSWYLKGGRSATWRKLSWDFPSPTVVTMPNHASTSMCHPDQLRALTVGECAAIQEFPANWRFSGQTSDKYKQIGNAVPLKLGEVAGNCAQALLDEIDSLGGSRKRGAVAPSRIEYLRSHVRTKRYWHKGQALAGDHDYYSTDNEEEEQLALI
ncbi:DNA cytosine methyltransferase [Stenotrophomonas maltophilia]|uniref:DNA cytosine methyltransferase n=1 Tax=Stenotrophomonas maltophilia TaxID=40324 RepID=UPI001FA8106C|nr:DNA cytosine methyltransferase [Stenotrophomonas maltophilia]